MSDEIIELGADGSFDISTKSVKQHVVEDIDYAAFDWEKAAQAEHSTTLLDALKANEFAIYHEGNDHIAIIRLPSGASLRDVSYGPKELLVNTDQSSLHVPLPEGLSIVSQSLQCKHHEDVVTVKFTAL